MMVLRYRSEVESIACQVSAVENIACKSEVQCSAVQGSAGQGNAGQVKELQEETVEWCSSARRLIVYFYCLS